MLGSHSWPSFKVWQLKVIFSIAYRIGKPFSLDDYIKNKSWGFFACVLVDVDFLSNLPNQILMKGQDLHLLLIWSMINCHYFAQIVK